MKSTKILIRYMLILSIMSSLGIWFCISKSCINIQNYLLEFEFFSVFIGNRNLVIDILLSISVTAWFATGGFIIDYINKKSHAQKHLLQMYNIIRERCFDKILFEDNYYKTNPDEVSSFLDYLYRHISNVTDYQFPIILKIKVKISNFIRIRIKKDRSELPTYFQEDKYALIVLLFSTLLSYFNPLNIIQTKIISEKKAISLCKNKISEKEKLGIDFSEYNTYLQITENELKKQYEILKEIKLNKDEIYKIFYAIDMKFTKDKGFSDYFYEEIFYKDIIIKDSDESSLKTNINDH